MERLNFCPRNQILQDMLANTIFDAIYGSDNDWVYKKIIVHHVTDIAKGALQLEYEMQHEDGKITFHRTVLT